MNRYFIDYENVLYNGVKGIKKLTKNDKAYLFYTANADKLDFGLYQELTAVSSSVELLDVDAGSNSLDFQLSTYLGSIVANNMKDSYYIVSKDQGFKAVVNFWKNRGVDIQQVNNMQMEDDRTIRNELLKLLPDYTEDLPAILEMIKKYKTKQGLNNALTKKYGTTKTGVIYKAIKPYIKDKTGK